MKQSDLNAIYTARHLPNTRAQNEHGYTLLHEAALSCNSSSIWRMSSLININADVNAVAKNGWSPLHIALFRKDTDKHSVIKVLTEANANVNITGTNGQTPLHNLASSSGTNNQEVKELITLLINAKADPNAKDNQGWSPLHNLASSSGANNQEVKELITLLINANADPNAKDNQGESPLHTAAANGDSNKRELIVSLINANADPNAKDNQGWSPLHTAAANGDSNKQELIVSLINANADVNAVDNEGKPPLFIASRSRGVDIERTLIENNADINHQDFGGNTVLHNLFVATNTIDIKTKLTFLVGAVIKHNSTLNLANKDGKTPLYCAAFGNSEQQEGECINELGLHHAAFLIKLAQEKNAKILVSSNESDRLNLAFEQSKQQNLQKPTNETTQNIKTISQFLSQYHIESFIEFVDKSAIWYDDDYYLGVD